MTVADLLVDGQCDGVGPIRCRDSVSPECVSNVVEWRWGPWGSRNDPGSSWAQRVDSCGSDSCGGSCQRRWWDVNVLCDIDSSRGSVSGILGYLQSNVLLRDLRTDVLLNDLWCDVRCNLWSDVLLKLLLDLLQETILTILVLLSLLEVLLTLLLLLREVVSYLLVLALHLVSQKRKCVLPGFEAVRSGSISGSGNGGGTGGSGLVLGLLVRHPVDQGLEMVTLAAGGCRRATWLSVSNDELRFLSIVVQVAYGLVWRRNLLLMHF